MQRKDFIRYSALAAGGTLIPGLVKAEGVEIKNDAINTGKPLAITMWDFSWLERRWPGAGYEDWDLALDELVERGYNAVRIDAYPHLVAEDAAREYTLLPVWNTQDWGSPDVNKVVIQPSLNQFIAKCKKRKIKVGLSTWYRQDTDKILMKIDGPQKMADNWIKTLKTITAAGLLDAILYVDLCNEWPGDLWCPYFKNDPPEKTWGFWYTAKSMQFMKDSITLVRSAYPQLPLCYSFTGGDPAMYPKQDLSFFDFIEHHIWMAQLNDGEYYKKVGYKYERFSPDGFKNLAANYEKIYAQNPGHWRQMLVDGIQLIANSAKAANQPLVTTECWGLVDFKDWPLLKWDIVKELCELGVRIAAATGQWLVIATSNFCGPQFKGMWRDVQWHKTQTDLIKKGVINEPLKESQLYKRLIA